MSEPKREDYKTEVEYWAALMRHKGVKLPDVSDMVHYRGDGHTHEEDK